MARMKHSEAKKRTKKDVSTPTKIAKKATPKKAGSAKKVGGSAKAAKAPEKSKSSAALQEAISESFEDQGHTVYKGPYGPDIVGKAVWSWWNHYGWNAALVTRCVSTTQLNVETGETTLNHEHFIAYEDGTDEEAVVFPDSTLVICGAKPEGEPASASGSKKKTPKSPAK